MSALTIEEMASGHLSLVLSNSVDWSEFPTYAQELLPLVNARVLEKIDSAVVRIWKLVLPEANLLLVFDDFPLAVSLESDDSAGDEFLLKLQDRLQTDKGLAKIVSR